LFKTPIASTLALFIEPSILSSAALVPLASVTFKPMAFNRASSIDFSV
jgi:hypothetical protein